MYRLIIIALVLIAGLSFFSTPAEATCSALPSDGYDLPGIVLRLKHTSSGECFNAWLNIGVEITSYLEKGTMSNPKLFVYAKSNASQIAYFGGHNSSYNWYPEVATFADGMTGTDVKPSDIDPVDNFISVMNVTVEDVVDNRVRDWVNLSVVNNKVDVGEIVLVTTGWNKAVGEAGYDWQLDIYPDGYIDIMDVMEMVDKWHQTASDWDQISQYTPTNCGTWDATAVGLSFENHDGTNRTFWVDIEQDGGVYRRPIYIGANDNTGVDLGPVGYGDVTEMRLYGSKTTDINATNISWSTTCSYAPPVGIKYDGKPDPLTGAAKAEAQAAGTWFTATDFANAPVITSQYAMNELGMTEAQFESLSTKEMELVPTYSPGRLAQNLFYIGGGDIQELGSVPNQWRATQWMFQIPSLQGFSELRIRSEVIKWDGAWQDVEWHKESFTNSAWVEHVPFGQGIMQAGRLYCNLRWYFVDGQNVTRDPRGRIEECVPE